MDKGPVGHNIFVWLLFTGHHRHGQRLLTTAVYRVSEQRYFVQICIAVDSNTLNNRCVDL